MVSGIERALADDPLGQLSEADQVEEATRTVAQIAGDMIKGGRGDQVLGLYAASVPKSGGGKDNAPRSALLEALNKLGSSSAAPQLSHQSIDDGEFTEETSGCDDRATDPKPEERQNKRIGAGQLPLINGHPAAGRREEEAPPTPPSTHTPHPLPLDTKNFEKNSEVVG